MIVSYSCYLLTPQGYKKPSVLAKKPDPEVVTGNGYRAIRITQSRSRSTFVKVTMDNGASVVVHEDDGLILKGGIYSKTDDLELGSKVRMTVSNIQNYFGWRQRDYRRAASKSLEAECAAKSCCTPILDQDISFLPERGVGFKRGYITGMLNASYSSKDSGWLRVNLLNDKSAEALYTTLAEFGVVSEIELAAHTQKEYSRVLLDISGVEKNIVEDCVSERNEVNGTARIVDIEPFDGFYYKLESNIDSVVINNTFHHVISNNA